MTKWDLLSQEEREALERTPFGGPCSGCGVTLETEADFARHFTIDDVRYPNLGWCPTQGRRDAGTP